MDKVTKWHFLSTSNKGIWPIKFLIFMHGAISKILFILGSYNFLASLECIRSYTWSKGHSDPDLSSVLRSIEQEFVTFLRHSLFQLKSSLEFQKCSSITRTIFSHRSSEQFWKQNTTISCCLFFFFTCEGNLLMEM